MDVNAIRDSLTTFSNLEERLASAVDYLSKENILVTTKKLYNQFLIGNIDNLLPLVPTSDTVLTDPLIGLGEFEFVHILRQKKITLRLYNSGEYANEYIYGFKIFTQEQILVDDKFTHTIWLSCNNICARYMKNETGFEFEGVNQYIGKQQHYARQSNGNKKKTSSVKNVQHIIIDRIHKCGLVEIAELVRLLSNNVTIYMFGDLEEYGPIYKKGTHHLLYELQGFDILKLPLSYTHTNITRIRGDILNSKLNSKYVGNLFKAKDLTELIKKIETPENKKKRYSITTQADEENNNRSYQLLCSNEYDGNIVNSVLLKKSGIEFIRGEFMLWDKVYVQEDGMIGRLEKVWKVDGYGNKKSLVNNLKEKINLFLGYYQFSLYQDTRIYSTSKCTVEHADIIPLSKFSGAPSDYIIFVVGKTTSFNDINIATKYARKDFKLMLLQDVKVGEVLSKRLDIFKYRFNNDLANKAYFVQQGFK